MTFFCILGANCAVYDRPTQLAGLCYSDPICTACENRGRQELNMLRYDYVDLSQLMPKPDSRGEVRIFRPLPESSPPISVAVFALRTEVAYVVAHTSETLRQFLGRRTGRAWPTREGWRLDQDVAFLINHVGDIARIPATTLMWSTEALEPTARTGADMLLVIGDLHRRVRKLCGLDPRTISVPGYCPECHLPALMRQEDDVDTLWCNNCRTRLSSFDYSNLVKMQLPPTATA